MGFPDIIRSPAIYDAAPGKPSATIEYAISGQNRTTAGDGQALDALRAREAAQGLKGDTIQGVGQAKPGHAPVIGSITKKGTIIYRAGSSAVRDDGERLAVSSQADRAGVAAALRLAMERYGERITVSGSVEFKVAVVRAAVHAQLPIAFADPALESRRQAEATKAQAKRRPGVPAVGQEPPPHRRHGLRTLGQLDGLHIEGEAQRPAERRPMPPRRRRRPRCSSRPGPRRPIWNSARRGYGRRWTPRRRNVRTRARGAVDDGAYACTCL